MNRSWPSVPLGEVLARVRKRVELAPDSTYKQVTVRLWGKGVVLRREVAGAEIASSGQTQVRSGQLVLSRIDARNGAIGLVPADLDGAIVSSDFPLFEMDERRVLPRYLEWLTRTREFTAACRSVSEGSTNRIRLKDDRFLALAIPLPPLAEQRRIVAKIDTIAQRVEEAKGLREKALRSAHVVFSAQHRQLVHYRADDDWKTASVEDCCAAIVDYRGRTPPTADRGIPHITTASIRDGQINWETSRFVAPEIYEQYMTRGIPEPGDVIFTMEAPLGEAAVVPDKRKFSLAQRTLLLRPDPNVLSGEFLATAITSPSVLDEILARATGTTVKGIAAKRLRSVPLPIPPPPEQRCIVAHLSELRAKVAELRQLQMQTASTLDALMPSVLDRAFKGEL